MKCVYNRVCHHIKCHIYHIYISIIIDKLQLQLRFTIRSVQIVASAVYKYTIQVYNQCNHSTIVTFE